jgi:Fic family protein
MRHRQSGLPAVRLFDLLPDHPIVTLATTVKLLKTTKPTAAKALAALQTCGILAERTGRRRDRVYGYQRYLKLLAEDTDLPVS